MSLHTACCLRRALIEIAAAKPAVGTALRVLIANPECKAAALTLARPPQRRVTVVPETVWTLDELIACETARWESYRAVCTPVTSQPAEDQGEQPQQAESAPPDQRVEQSEDAIPSKTTCDTSAHAMSEQPDAQPLPPPPLSASPQVPLPVTLVELSLTHVSGEADSSRNDAPEATTEDGAPLDTSALTSSADDRDGRAPALYAPLTSMPVVTDWTALSRATLDECIAFEVRARRHLADCERRRLRRLADDAVRAQRVAAREQRRAERERQAAAEEAAKRERKEQRRAAAEQKRAEVEQKKRDAAEQRRAAREARTREEQLTKERQAAERVARDAARREKLATEAETKQKRATPVARGAPPAMVPSTTKPPTPTE